MNKRILLLVLALLTASLTYAISIGGNKYLEGKILLEDGSVMEGFVKVPNIPRKNNISFKTEKKAKAQTIDSELIASILVKTKTNKIYRFDNLKVDVRRKADEPNISNRKFFLMVMTEGYATLYLAANGYKTHKSGNILVEATYQQGTLPTYNYYIRKRGEQVATIFTQTSNSGTMFGLNKMLIKRSEMLLADDPELVERIKSKEFKHVDVIELINIYNKDMESLNNN
ncbi:hypothetical protein [Anaerophaga thermohalophila]|uniref:hypothetical protein n=1 Tax=Anaerophaga thermohalophila TaxID=177400 RepID=UPI000237D3FC|nr:hypothetical protein [Anaerophaga thermohalophila]